MPNIFISYRRADSSAHVGRIYDRLVQAFGKKHIFKDVDNIPVGVDFRQVLAREVNKCDIVLVVMGRYCLTVTDDYGRRRIDNPDDFVRIEVATALARANCLVVPVLLQGAQMPPPHYLPPDLQMLCYKNAAIVRDDPDFHNDLTRLVIGLGGKPMKKRRGIGFWFRWLLMIAIVVGVGVGIALLFDALTKSVPTTPSNSPDSPQLSFAEQAEGIYQLQSYYETTSPYTMYMDVLDGTLQIDSSGRATWNLSIRERGENTNPIPALDCVGQIRSSQQLDGLRGNGTTTYNWTSDMESIDMSGVVSLMLAFCGWTNTPVSRDGDSRNDAPFSLSLTSSGSQKILEMTNSEGVFIWVRN